MESAGSRHIGHVISAADQNQFGKRTWSRCKQRRVALVAQAESLQSGGKPVEILRADRDPPIQVEQDRRQYRGNAAGARPQRYGISIRARIDMRSQAGQGLEKISAQPWNPEGKAAS